MIRLLGLAVLALAVLQVRCGLTSAVTEVYAETSATNATTSPHNYNTTTLHATTVATDTLSSTTDGTTAVCPAYCDVFGYYIGRRICVSMTNQKVYCCGNDKYKYCCTDVRRKITVDYPEVKSCPNSAWWLFHWRIIVGLLGTVMVIMMFGACVYYCCLGLCRKNERVQRVRRRFISTPGDQTTNTQSETRGADTQNTSFTFDPSNPNAFQPPPYESLPKDPPKYTDIFNPEGQDNQAFQAETPTDGAVGVATAAAVVAGAAAASAPGTSGNQPTTSGSSSTSSSATPPSPNRTTEVTSSVASPAAAVATSAVMTDVAGDSPPPYTRTDPSQAAVVPPAAPTGNQGATAATAAASSAESVQRIQVGTAVAAESSGSSS